MTYQPFSTCEDPSFREMTESIHPKITHISRKKVVKMLSDLYAEYRIRLKKVLIGTFVTITTDAWTSIANIGFVAVTIHFIDPITWAMYTMALGCSPKKGTSKAADVVREIEETLKSFDINYTQLVCIVSDTEPTMVAAGRLFRENAKKDNATTSWHGCIDHIIELVTRIAFEDTADSQNVMTKARALVSHFSHSSQATELLLSKQTSNMQLKCIQDVVTRWWSTYSMCERLLKLKPYIQLLEVERHIDGRVNLTDEQWIILHQITILLEPFMIAQKFLEGERYVTLSFVPYIINSMRTSMAKLIDDENSSLHLKTISEKMLNAFNGHFGVGSDGTVFAESETEGVRRRPKGIPKLALVATLLDPRTKLGLGIPAEDVDTTYDYLQQLIIEEATHLDEKNRHIEVDDVETVIENPRKISRQEVDMADIFADLDNAVKSYISRGRDSAGEPSIDETSNTMKANAEVILYRAELPMPRKSELNEFLNPLNWWKLNSSRFPLISIVARKVLSIPATSAPSERVFSSAGLTISRSRASIEPANASELIFLHETMPEIEKYMKSHK